MKLLVAAGFFLCFAHSVRAAALKKSDLLFGKECLPGTNWTSHCNECTCSDEGLPLCIENKCEGHENNQMLRCAPDSIWKYECNTCWCTSTGHAMCTRIGCNAHVVTNFNPDGGKEQFLEVPSVNELKTSANSTKAVVCAANRMFIKDCNTCWCNEDGTSYFCTRKVCVPDFPDETTAEPEELRVIKRQCRPDEVFELDCNMCRCNPDGKSFSCTRRACLPEDDNKETSVIRRTRATSQASSRSESSSSSRFQHNVKETPKTCQPGQEFRMDCNTCLCNSEGQDYSCTRIDCNALNNNNNGGARRKREVTSQVTSECTPGSVFQQGCKVCRCSEDGRHAICPTHCQKDKDHSNQKTENDISTESDPSFRCNPGETYKRFCNDCTCSADGRSVFCTLRLCEEEITPTI